MQEFPQKILELLVCPLSKSALRYQKETQELLSEESGLAYPVREGIPIMLIDEARVVDAEKASKFQYLFSPRQE